MDRLIHEFFINVRPTVITTNVVKISVSKARLVDQDNNKTTHRHLFSEQQRTLNGLKDEVFVTSRGPNNPNTLFTTLIFTGI